jgi:L-ascorbate metabolism protein UlaG (beta-lactamase superfamily)
MGISGDLCRTLNVGESVECPPFSFTATNAYHSDEHAIGLIIEVDNRRIYFSGDTENKNYLAKSVNGMSGNEIDIAFICINGKMGNMNIDNAVKVMAEVRPAVAIPMHYGLFAGNTVDPAPFIRKCDAVGVKAALLEIGRGTDMSELLE